MIYIQRGRWGRVVETNYRQVNVQGDTRSPHASLEGLFEGGSR